MKEATRRYEDALDNLSDAKCFFEEARSKLSVEIRKRRNELGMSLDDVATKLHISKGFLHDIELNRRAMSMETYEKLTELLKP